MKEINIHDKEAKQERKNRKCQISCHKDKEGSLNFSINKEEEIDPLLESIAGTPNRELANSIIASGTKALPNSLDEASKFNLILENLADSTPNDAHEARLSTQAAVLYTQATDYLNKARSVLFDDGTFAKDHWHSIFMKDATRLLDLHTKTVEALIRYRQRGEQRIVVQHVTVQDGGKAIVGNLMPGGDSTH